LNFRLIGCCLAIGLWMLLVGCSSQEPEPIVIFVTATPGVSSPNQDQTVSSPVPISTATPVRLDVSPVPQSIAAQPTADPTRFEVASGNTAQQHIVQPGDTLFGISVLYGVSLDSILDLNALENPDQLTVGQVIVLPEPPTQTTPNIKLLPDSKLVRAPGSRAFDVQSFVSKQPGYISTATDTVPTRLFNGGEREEILSAAEVVQRVALEFSVDARLLLAILEYEAGWLSRSDIPDDLKSHPLISEADSAGIDRSGLYRQLTWAANTLNWGYYGWKFRGWTTLEFDGSGVRLLYDPGLNAGTVALQYYFARNRPFELWQRDITASGLYATYFAFFGDPFQNVIDPLFPPGTSQPPMTLPFASGETWFFTGGWHGGWGAGSAWSAVDFAPPDEVTDGVFCYVSEYPVRAVANGIIARSESGAVILDLDGDGDESTGWTVLYLHLASTGRIPAGSSVVAGDPVGYASCEGGFSTATHLHIARRYNGEWIPADCLECVGPHVRPPFVMSGWQVVGLQNQEYQGFLDGGGERRIAEQGRLTPVNRITW